MGPMVGAEVVVAKSDSCAKREAALWMSMMIDTWRSFLQRTRCCGPRLLP